MVGCVYRLRCVACAHTAVTDQAKPWVGSWASFFAWAWRAGALSQHTRVGQRRKKRQAASSLMASPPAPSPVPESPRLLGRCRDNPFYFDRFRCSDWANKPCTGAGAAWGVDELFLLYSCPEACSDVTPQCHPPMPPSPTRPPELPPPSSPPPMPPVPRMPISYAPPLPSWLFTREALPAVHRIARAPPYLPHVGHRWPLITPSPLPDGAPDPEVRVNVEWAGFLVTPFHLASNLPLFMPKCEQGCERLLFTCYPPCAPSPLPTPPLYPISASQGLSSFASPPQAGGGRHRRVALAGRRDWRRVVPNHQPRHVGGRLLRPLPCAAEHGA